MRPQALTEKERQIVQQHRDLVNTALRRYRSRSSSPHVEDEKQELCQEGCLALMAAVRSHDPRRHGEFPAYALARIRYAMSRFSQEHRPLIRVPFITQRRRRHLHGKPTTDSKRPLRVFSLSTREDLHDRGIPDKRNDPGDRSIAAPGATTLAELVRHRYDRAVDHVVRDLIAARRHTAQAREIIRRCRRERWSVPEREAQTSIRKLAAELDCSVGRITHCESQFRRKLAGVLRSDVIFRWLRRTARRHPRGWEHTLTDVEVNGLSRSRRKQRRRAHRKPRRFTPRGCHRSREHCLSQPHSQP